MIKPLFATWDSYFQAGADYAAKTKKAWFDSASQNFNASFQYFNQALALFAQSVGEQPSQDFYYLYYGKTLLEYLLLIRTARYRAQGRLDES